MDLITRGCFMSAGCVLVTGSVTGASSLSVPAGVTSITFTGQGGVGVYNAGQSFIAASPSNWKIHSSGLRYTQSGIIPSPSTRYSSLAAAYAGDFTYVGQALSVEAWADSGNGSGGWEFRSYVIVCTSLYVAGRPYIAPYYSAGPGTTASSAQSTNGTKTWASHAAAGNPAAYQQTMTLSGAAATISYSVANGTTLSYEYML